MRQLHLQASDAYILAVAERLGVENIASLDRDFLRITQTDFNLYTSQAVQNSTPL